MFSAGAKLTWHFVDWITHGFLVFKKKDISYKITDKNHKKTDQFGASGQSRSC